MTDRTIARLSTGLAVLAIASIFYFSAELLGLAPTVRFWEGFFGTLIAGIFLFALMALVIPWYQNLIRSPHLYLKPNSDFELTRGLDGRRRGTLQLSVVNCGRYPITSYYWHLLVPHGLQVKIQDSRGITLSARKVGSHFLYQGYVQASPVFPNCSVELPVNVILETADTRDFWRLKYSLDTEFGSCPQEMNRHERIHESAVPDCAVMVLAVS